MRRAIHIRAHIQQHCRSSRSRGKNRRQRGTIHSRQRAQHHFCRGHGGAGVAGSNKSGGLPLAHQPQTYAHGGVALGAHGLHRLIFHGDDFAGVDDFDRQTRGRRMAVEFGFDDGFRTDEQHAHAIIARSVNRPFDFRLGRPVRTHRIQRDHARHVGRS